MPGSRFGATSSRKSAACGPSGTSIATTCAPFTASATSRTGSPASSALRRDVLVGLQADDDLDAGVGEVERVRVALAAVADHRDLAREEARVPRLDHFFHDACLSLRDCRGRGPRLDGCRGGGGRSGRCGRARARRAGGRAPRTRRGPPGRPTISNVIASRPMSATRAPKTSPSAISSARLSARRGDGDQRQLALDRLLRPQLDDAQDVDELVDLLLDLLERVLGAVDAERQPRDVRPLGRARRRGAGCCSRAARTSATTRASAPGLFSSSTETV